MGIRRTPPAARSAWSCSVSMPTLAPNLLPADRPDALDHGGLDLCQPMFASWLLGCPGTPRQHPAFAASRGYRRWDKMTAPGTCRHRLTPVHSGRLEQSSGLLICGHIGPVAGFPMATCMTTTCASVLARPVARNDAYRTPLILQPGLRQPTGLTAAWIERAPQPGDPARHRRRYTTGT